MEKKLTRRVFLRVAGMGAAAVVAAACQPKVVEVTKIVEKEKVVEKPVEKVVEKTVVVEKEKVVKETVVVEKTVEVKAPVPKGKVIFWGHDQHPLDLAGAGFQQKYPEVKWESPHPADRGAKIKAAMAAGSGCPDLFWAEATDAQDWGCHDLLTDLTEELTPVKDQYHPAKLQETFIVKTGKYIGWPGDISVSGWYYRYDILEKEFGLKDEDINKMTWDDFILFAKEAAKKGKYVYIQPASGHPQPFEYVMHQVGGSLVSKDGQKITMNDEKGVLAATICKKLYDTGAALDVGWLQPPYYAALKEGTLIGAFIAAWEKGFWESALKGPEESVGYWRVAKFPGGEGIKYRTGIFGGAQLVTPKCAENRDNAILFMKYALGSLEGCALTGGWGIIPAYRPYLNSTLFTKARTPLFGDWPFNEFWASQEKELSPDYVRPAGWGALDALFWAGEFMPILKGEVGIKEGLDKFVEKATPDFERTKCKL